MRWFDFVARWMSRPVKDLAIECAGMTARYELAVDTILGEAEDRMKECESDEERKSMADEAAAEVSRRSEDLETAVMLATVRAEFRVRIRQTLAVTLPVLLLILSALFLPLR